MARKWGQEDGDGKNGNYGSGKGDRQSFRRSYRRSYRQSYRRRLGQWFGGEGLIFAREIRDVAPGEGFEAEVEDAVEFVEGDAHIEADLGGGETVL